jgi:hypothetical protein
MLIHVIIDKIGNGYIKFNPLKVKIKKSNPIKKMTLEIILPIVNNALVKVTAAM